MLPIDGIYDDVRMVPMGRKPEKTRYQRLRLDSGQHIRLVIVMGLLGIGAFVPVAWRLWDLMVKNYDLYADLALRNQTRNTAVLAPRGEIYDRNMNILASSVTVENVYLDPHELKQSGADLKMVSRELGAILGKDPQWIFEQSKDLRRRYKQIGSQVEEETGAEIRDFINRENLSGIHLEPSSRRVYPQGTLAAQLLGFTNVSGQGSEGIEAHYDSFLSGKTGTVITTKGGNEMDMPFSFEDYVRKNQGCSLILTLDTTVQM